jgi:two-component system, NarL family, sensor histidine kinase UhpB
VNTGFGLIYFVYGLAFFSLGLVILLEAGRSPFLVEGRVLVPLALFGLVHGFHEWFELYIMKGDGSLVINPEWVGWSRLFLLVISFSFLTIFGVQGFFTPKNSPYMFLVLPVGMVVSFGFMIIIDQQLHTHKPGELVGHIDVFVRYFLGVTGALLAGSALAYQGRRARLIQKQHLALVLWVASGSFMIYGLTQMIVTPQEFFPASILNTANFGLVVGFPIQIVRGVLAVAITISLIRAVQLADAERRARYESAQQDRLKTLEQLKGELETREALRQELMQHIVLAQEAERTRVARELHDDTAQLLTAFNFQLASLRDTLGMDGQVSRQIRQLRSLSDRMAHSLYRMIHDLRPAQLDDLGIVPALEFLRDEMLKNYGLVVYIIVSGQRQRIDNLVETVIFRVAQEAVTNIARHSDVNKATLLITFTSEEICLEIQDLGKGFDLSQVMGSKCAFGLAGMAERVEAVKGSFRIETAPGKGCKIKVGIPLLGNYVFNESPSGMIEVQGQ